MLATARKKATALRSEAADQVSDHAAKAREAQAELARREDDIRLFDQLLAMLAGEAIVPGPEAIASAEGAIGLAVGPLRFGLPPNPTAEQRAAYAEAMRALVNQANHQVVLATDLERRVVAQADVPTAGDPVVEDPVIAAPSVAVINTAAGSVSVCAVPVDGSPVVHEGRPICGEPVAVLRPCPAHGIPLQEPYGEPAAAPLGSAYADQADWETELLRGDGEPESLGQARFAEPTTEVLERLGRGLENLPGDEATGGAA